MPANELLTDIFQETGISLPVIIMSATRRWSTLIQYNINIPVRFIEEFKEKVMLEVLYSQLGWTK